MVWWVGLLRALAVDPLPTFFALPIDFVAVGWLGVGGWSPTPASARSGSRCLGGYHCERLQGR